MKKFGKIFAILMLSLLLIGALTACGGNNQEPNEVNAPAEVEAPAEVDAPAEVEEPTEIVYEPQPFGDNLPTAPTNSTPLVVAFQDFSQKFSPFFSDTGYDAAVAGMTQIDLLTTDRVGGIIHNAIEGETRSFNGIDYLYKGPANTNVEYDEATDTTKYTARLRVGMQFSDGVPVTIDDLIFSYYTFLDPSYVGSTSLGSYDIIGLKDYQTQTTSDVFDKYNAMAADIYAAGMDHEWSDADSWTMEQQDDFWTRVNVLLVREAEGIVRFVMANYLPYAEQYAGMTEAEIVGNESMEVAFGMAMWGFGERLEDGSFVAAGTETTFDLVETFPTMDDYVQSILVSYEFDLEAAFPYESADGNEVLTPAKSGFIGIWGPLDESMGGEGVPNIAGIVKVDDYTVEVTVNGFSAPAVYSILGISISPLHYYGDAAKYDFDNDMFGFDFGDLSKQESLTATPMGAGPYKFVEYNNRVVFFEANEFFYKGSPVINEIQFKETATAEVPSAVQTGTADAGELSYTSARFAEVQSYNANGETTGDIITMSKVDNLGYGYIGLNANTVNVDGDTGSDASKNLRRGLATVLAVHREVAIDSYYGEAASVINYPVSNTSWVAPQTTDDDYNVAYSTDVDGNPIYTVDMTAAEKYAAAETAALGFFEAAGFTVVDGKITAAPEGSKLNFEVIVPADGVGDHPAFAILTAAKEAFANIGIEFNINDPADANILWDALDASSQELWAAAWGSTIDPDMYQVYHSTSVVGAGGSESNAYAITDAELDQLIMDGRAVDDQNYRKTVYKQAFEVILDWAVELPTYQRQNAVIFSTERIDINTITPDITTYWGWLSDVELLDMLP